MLYHHLNCYHDEKTYVSDSGLAHIIELVLEAKVVPLKSTCPGKEISYERSLTHKIFENFLEDEVSEEKRLEEILTSTLSASR